MSSSKLKKHGQMRGKSIITISRYGEEVKKKASDGGGEGSLMKSHMQM